MVVHTKTLVTEDEFAELRNAIIEARPAMFREQSIDLYGVEIAACQPEKGGVVVTIAVRIPEMIREPIHSWDFEY